jgi:ABC-type sugar transport system substrate-binding protein
VFVALSIYAQRGTPSVWRSMSTTAAIRAKTDRIESPPQPSETDIDTQINAVENFITKKVDAIVVAPADSRALVLTSLAKESIPQIS